MGESLTIESLTRFLYRPVDLRLVEEAASDRFGSEAARHLPRSLPSVTIRSTGRVRARNGRFKGNDL